MNKFQISMNEMKDLSQKIAEAIESVTKIDVTIMDSERNRIAATGRYQHPEFGNIAEKSAFSACLATGEVCIIEEPRVSEICQECFSVDKCVEEAEICVPIAWKSKSIGVIGLIAFSQEQKRTILDNCQAYVNFVQKMASLLEAKYGELVALEENRRLTQKMTAVVNSSKREKYLYLLDDSDELKQELISSAEDQCGITFGSILSVSGVMQEVKDMAQKVSETESPVMIRGESGTGKELFARAMHQAGKRSRKPFIPINCGAIPDELLESELFGYEKGAFTGAHASKAGKFEIANGGTIFLDEIGELPLKLQVKLLRVLQEKEYTRLGSNETKKIDVRIFSATNANLEERIRKNLFREDLYYRLNIFPLHIPPLRERKEDIDYLAQYFLQYYNHQFEKNIKGLSREVGIMFREYQWPGNVRELQNVMEFGICLENREFLSEPLIRRRLNLKDGEKSSTNQSASVSSLHISRPEDGKFLYLLEKYKDLPRKELVHQVCNEMGISRATFYRKRKNLETE